MQARQLNYYYFKDDEDKLSDIKEDAIVLMGGKVIPHHEPWVTRTYKRCKYFSLNAFLVRNKEIIPLPNLELHDALMLAINLNADSNTGLIPVCEDYLIYKILINRVDSLLKRADIDYPRITFFLSAEGELVSPFPEVPLGSKVTNIHPIVAAFNLISNPDVSDMLQLMRVLKASKSLQEISSYKQFLPGLRLRNYLKPLSKEISLDEMISTFLKANKFSEEDFTMKPVI